MEILSYKDLIPSLAEVIGSIIFLYWESCITINSYNGTLQFLANSLKAEAFSLSVEYFSQILIFNTTPYFDIDIDLGVFGQKSWK